MRIYVNQISLNPSAMAGILGRIAFLVILASLGMQGLKFASGYGSMKGLVQLFYVDSEHNIPTYFSILLMLFVALLLAIITMLNKQQKMPHVSKWAVLSYGFLFMAFDEAFQFHEKLILPMRSLLGNANLGVFYFAWVIPGIVLVITLGLFFLRFLLDLPPKTKRRFLMAAAIYLTGVLGMELVGGSYAEIYGLDNWGYNIIVTVEESLEMAGLIFFIWSLLKYCEHSYGEVRFQLGDQ